MRNRLKVLRAEKNYTQADLAALVSVTRQTINSIESGKYVPTTILSLKLARAFDKRVEDIFELEEKD